MNFTTFMGFVAGLLQFVVAGYALWLNRCFGTKRVGWSLFWAFLLLAFLHLAQSVMERGAGDQFGIKVDAMNVLISLLLLIGLIHMEAMLKERIRVAAEQQRMRDELESEVKKKTSYLTRALEELTTEIDERKRMETEAQSTRWELSVVSRRAELAQMAASVLQTVGDMLQSVNASAKLVSDQVKQSRIANVVRVGNLIRDHAADLGTFMTRDPRGQKLPIYIAQLAEHLSTEQTDLLTELESIRTNLEKIRGVEQDYAKLAGEADSQKTAIPAHNLPPAAAA